MTLAGPPSMPVGVPAAVIDVARGRSVEAVWRNELGGITFRIGRDLHVKWHPSAVPYDPAADLEAEAERIAWLAPFTPVPKVVGIGRDAEGSWLVTETFPGRSAVDARWIADPGPAIEAIAVGLRRFHDVVPVGDCPFDWSAAARLADARARRDSGRLLPVTRRPEEFEDLSLDAVFSVLADPPDIDRLVVCHGDPCAPNTLVADDGTFAAHVDLARVGAADRWADLAVASWSLDWNYGPGWESIFFATYGIEPDRERISWYRLLWEC